MQYGLVNSNLGNNIFCENNSYWTTAGDPTSDSNWEDTNLIPYNWDQWRGRGNDDQSPGTLAAQGFVDAANNNFTLNPDSPLIDKGAYLARVTQSGSNTTILYVNDHGYVYPTCQLSRLDG